MGEIDTWTEVTGQEAQRLSGRAEGSNFLIAWVVSLVTSPYPCAIQEPTKKGIIRTKGIPITGKLKGFRAL